MSSSYDWLCLAHDPALPLGYSRTLDDLIATPIDAHATCDMLIARLSGGLIELGCPAGSRHPRTFHSVIDWMDTNLLRLIAAAAQAQYDDALNSALAPILSACWSRERLARIAPLLA